MNKPIFDPSSTSKPSAGDSDDFDELENKLWFYYEMIQKKNEQILELRQEVFGLQAEEEGMARKQAADKAELLTRAGLACWKEEHISNQIKVVTLRKPKSR